MRREWIGTITTPTRLLSWRMRHGTLPGAARRGQSGGRGPGTAPDRPGDRDGPKDGGLGRTGGPEGKSDPPQREAPGRADSHAAGRAAEPAAGVDRRRGPPAERRSPPGGRLA